MIRSTRPFLASIRLTLLLAALAVGAWLAPGVAPLLQYDRSALSRGELWRLLTGHLTHWTADHLLWDVAVFAAAGAACERGGRRTYAALLAAAALGVSAAVFLALPTMRTYRGLSGVDTALVAYLTVTRLRGRWAMAGISLLLLKLAVEAATGATAFVAPAGFAPVPLAHAAGAAVGFAFGLRAMFGRRVSRPVGVGIFGYVWSCGRFGSTGNPLRSFFVRRSIRLRT